MSGRPRLRPAPPGRAAFRTLQAGPGRPARSRGTAQGTAPLVIFLLLAFQGLNPVDQAGFRKVLDAHKGKVVLVDFWATWCDPCREEMPVLVQLARKLQGRGVALVTVSADEPEQETAAAAFLKKAGAPFPAYVRRAASDEDFINSIDRKWSGALPAVFLYDRQGRQAGSFIGESDTAQIEAAIRKLL